MLKVIVCHHFAVTRLPFYLRTLWMQKKVQLSRDRAWELTVTHFRHNRADDESDAFRYFVWSGILTQLTSAQFAKDYTDAHESCVTQDLGQTMDYENNRLGRVTAQKMKESGDLSEERWCNRHCSCCNKKINSHQA